MLGWKIVRSSMRGNCAHIPLCPSRPYGVAAVDSYPAAVFSRYLRQRIKATGAVTVAEYMKECLTNPMYGYYSRKNPFGREGDFITSPEVCQIFGELLAIWCVNEWSISGKKLPVQVVELGPGTGVLASDLLRIFKSFPSLRDRLSLHLVEKSRDLATTQAVLLGVPEPAAFCDSQASYKLGMSKYGVPVYWYTSFDDVPQLPSYIIGNEFFDALPVHKFQQTKEHGLREILVDIAEGDDGLRFVLAPQETPALKFIPASARDRTHLELSIEAALLANNIAERVNQLGGAALIIDYGHSGEKTDTFRAFRNHKVTNPLHDPGQCDLTADVDFSLIKAFVGTKAVTSGPIPQYSFLSSLAFEQRFDALTRACTTPEKRQKLAEACDLLINPTKMGGQFHVLCISGHQRDMIGPMTGFA